MAPTNVANVTEVAAKISDSLSHLMMNDKITKAIAINMHTIAICIYVQLQPSLCSLLLPNFLSIANRPPYDTQVQASNSVSINHTTKNVGIHLLPVCYLRPTTALCTDEQSDTHERIADTPVSVL